MSANNRNIWRGLAIRLSLVGLGGALYFWLIYPVNAERKQQRLAATEIMQRECALHCAQYGIKQSDLGGQKRDSEKHSKGSGDFSYSWSAAATAQHPEVTFSVRRSYDPQTPLKTETQWHAAQAPKLPAVS